MNYRISIVWNQEKLCLAILLIVKEIFFWIVFCHFHALFIIIQLIRMRNILKGYKIFYCISNFKKNIEQNKWQIPGIVNSRRYTKQENFLVHFYLSCSANLQFPLGLFICHIFDTKFIICQEISTHLSCIGKFFICLHIIYEFLVSEMYFCPQC